MCKTTVMAQFVIEAEDFDPKEITERLSLIPTRCWRKNDPIRDTHRKRQSSCWIIGTDYEESLDINEQLNKVFSLIEGKESALLEFASEYPYELDYAFIVVIHIGEQTPGMHLSKETIKKVSELNACMDFDTYK